MYIHQVLFKIQKKNIPLFLRDSNLWSKAAHAHPGFIAYHTLFRTPEKDEYAACYIWKNRMDHVRFMKINHDRLVLLSKCPVEVLGYYNFHTHQTKLA